MRATPFNPSLGWRQASSTTRILAVLAVPSVLATSFLFADDLPYDLVTFLTYSLGPISTYCLARVMRPHVRRWDVERILRHVPSSAAMFWGLTLGGGNLVLALVAAGIGVVTIVWGLVAMLVRTCLASSRSAEG